MPDSDTETRAAHLTPELREMKIEEGTAAVAASMRGGGGDLGLPATAEKEPSHDESAAPTPPTALPPRPASQLKSESPVEKTGSAISSPGTGPREEIVGGDITLKMEPGKAPKLARKAAKKVVSGPAPLYLDLPDSTEDAKKTFAVLKECTYANKSLGATDHALECDCAEEWDPVSQTNNACGEDSDCINRATKMECVGDCACGSECQNQRFLRKQYADVSVIKTEKKGFGLRTNHNLNTGDFIFEYIGEVIEERAFRRRMIQYDQDGIKHFYFMSLTKGEFVDATKKGNLGRFCNHSCNPNCYVDKWVVGDKLRMGIFAERKIKAGEELVFNYNVDRYGADPQPCYCGEPNCSGFIGGKTQTDNATKLSHATIEALGIDDGDSWETAVAKKPRKKKASEEDEEYVNDIMPKSLEESGVNKVMAALRQCTEKWVAVKLLSRLQRSADDERVGHRVIRVHGYEIIKATIAAWIDDANVILQALDILKRLPRITRNKIQDSKIEETIVKLKTFEDERVQNEATTLLEAWSKLEIAYRIPRMKRDPNASSTPRENHFERREKGRERSPARERSMSPVTAAPKGPASKGPFAASIPSGPRAFRENVALFKGPRPPRPRQPFNPLPPGWSQAMSDTGAVYYYNINGVTQWQRPTSGIQQPSAPPKAKSNEQRLQDIITSITQNATSTKSEPATPQPAEEQKVEKSKSEKWKGLSQEKQEKLYERTLNPHVMAVVSHYRNRLDKEDLKRLSKEVAKKLVRGDYKHNRVGNPTAKLDPKHERTVKKFVKDYLDKAVQKKGVRDKEKAAKAAKLKAEGKTAVDSPDTPAVSKGSDDKEEDDDDDPAGFSGDENADESPVSGSASGSDLKRKREDTVDGAPSSPKKTRTEVLAPPPPPPPPPPPAGDADADAAMDDGAVQFPRVPSPVEMSTPPTSRSCEIDDGDNNNTMVNSKASHLAMVTDGS